MSLAEGKFELTGIDNPQVDNIIQERVNGVPFRQIFVEMLGEKKFPSIKNNGARLDRNRAMSISSDGTIFNSDNIVFDEDSYFLEVERHGRTETAFLIESDQGLLVASEDSGAGFITEEGSIGAGFRDDGVFDDIENFLRGEFDLTDRTHLFEHDNVFKLPNYSNVLLDDGSVPEPERQFLSSGEFEPVYEDEENSAGLWIGEDYAFTGRIDEDTVKIDNFQETEYSIDVSTLDPKTDSLDISDVDRYSEIDLGFLGDQILEMSSEDGEGLVQNSDEEQNLLGFKQNSSKSELDVLGAGEHELQFDNGVKKRLEKFLTSGGNISKLKSRLGRMVENPYDDDRFEGHELGYWKGANDLRIYTYTPRGRNQTFVLEAGTHRDIEALYNSDNPSEIAQVLLDNYTSEELLRDIPGYLEEEEEGPFASTGGLELNEVGKDNQVKGHFEVNEFYGLGNILRDAGYNLDHIEATQRFLEENITSYFDIRPDSTEYENFVNPDRRYDADSLDEYDRIDLVVEGSLGEVRMLADSDIANSLDSDAEYNEVHLGEDLSVNLRFEES